MHRFFHLLLLCGILLQTTMTQAQEPAGFAPSQAHPINHYQEIWKKNPFTLKTAPAAIKKESFARDMVLGSLVQFGQETIAVIVNTQTRERIELSNLQNADKEDQKSLRLVRAELAESREKSFIEIARNGETAVLHFDEAFQKQLAASPADASARRGDPAQTVASARLSRNSSETHSSRERRRRATTPDTPQ